MRKEKMGRSQGVIVVMTCEHPLLNLAWAHTNVLDASLSVVRGPHVGAKGTRGRFS